MVQEQAPGWWERFDVGAVAGDDGLDPLDLGVPPVPGADLYSPRVEPPTTTFKPISPTYRWDLPPALRQLRQEIPAVPRSSGFFKRMAGSVFDITGNVVGTALDVLTWPAEMTERIAGLYYWNELSMGDRWAMGKLTYEQFGFGKGRQREEILRRYRAGEDIDKIAEDFEGGVSDLVGQLLADPLNLLGVPGLGLLAKVTDIAKVPRISRTFRALNKGLVLPRFSLRELQAADIVSNVRGARPASNWVTRSLRRVGVNETADERILNRVEQMVRDTRNWGVDPAEARRLVDDWRLRGTGVGWNSVRLTGQSRAVEAKRAGYELLDRLAENPRLTHDDLIRFQDQIISGAWDSELVRNNPDWLVPGTMRDTMVPQWWERIRGGLHPNPPQGLLVLDAAGAEARGTGLTAGRIFRKSRGPWFEGTAEEYAALTPAERKAIPFANRKQWKSTFLEEWTRFSEGDGKVAGAIDHYFGIGGADIVAGADGQLVVVPRALTDLEKFDRKAQAAQGHFKSVLGIAFLNKPAYMVANAVTNMTFGLMRIGKGVWRNSDEDEARIGADLLRRFTYDVGRAGYQSIKQLPLGEAPPGAVPFKTALKSSLLTWRPFSNMANQSPYFGDIDIRRRIAIETYHNVFNPGFVPEDLSEFGILKAIRWAEGTTAEEQRAFLSRLQNVRNEEELATLGRELENGTLSVDPAGYLLQRVLETDGVNQMQAAYLRNLLGEKHHRELGAALTAARDPTEARHAIDRVSGSLSELSYDFMKDIPLPIYRPARANLRKMRVQNSVIIRRWFEGLNAAVERSADMHGVRHPRFKEELEELTSTLEGGQQRMFARLDNELSPYNAANDVATAEGRAAMRTKRQAVVREYYDLQTEAWARADAELRPLFTKPKLRDWWSDFQKRRRGADMAVRSRLEKVFGSLRDDWAYLDEASDEWRGYFAYRDEVYQRLLDETYWGIRLRKLPSEMEPITEEGIDMAHGMMRYADEQAEYLRKMSEHVDDLFEPLRRETVDGVEQVVEWGPRRLVIDPVHATELRRYLDEDVLPDLRVMQTVALRAGRAMADDALLSYETRYGFDKMLTYLLPYGFWPSRMAHRWVKAAQARPGAAAAFAKLIDGQREMQDELPERLRGRLRIPVPFLPDWMSGELFFDPIRYFFPPSVSIDQDIEGDTVFGTVFNWAQSVGAMPSPIVSLPLQFSGVLGERDSYIRYFMSGGPWLLPGTSGQRAITSFLRGAPAGDWQDGLPPEDWDKIMLGEALPEPRIREILGIPPGDQWDGYRILRSIASGAADGSWSAEDAVRAMQRRAGPIWERGKVRAEDEAGVRELSTWLGVPASLYPKGERIQNGLQAMYSVSRDIDRASGNDETIDAFYTAFPEFQARSIQRAWHRGVQAVETEADTSAYYIDLAQIKEQYDPQIEYLTQVRDSMRGVRRTPWTDQLRAAYDERSARMDALKLAYPRRRTAPSLNAAPHDRALSYLREQYYNLKGDSYASERAAQEMFLSRLIGRGQAGSYYRLAVKRDDLFAQFNQRLAGAMANDREKIFEERKQAIEALTQQAIPDISREDFEHYLARSGREPEDEEAERQRQSDALTALFSSTDAQRFLREHPELALQYGPTPDPEAAGQMDSWWSWYYALPPNSLARDDYVESYLPQLNEWRARVGLIPLSPRQRPEAGPIVINEDPYQQAIAAAEAAAGAQ